MNVLARAIGQGLVNAAWYAAHPGRLLPSRAAPRRPVRARFDGAKGGRLVASWSTTSNSIDADLWRDLPSLRARSRDLFANNEFGKRFAHAVRCNVAGPSGLVLQNRARFASTGELDKRANDLIEAAFRTWSKHGQCDVTRKLSRSELERLLVETVARDGEVLLRKVRGYGNRAGYALQLLEADHLDHDHTVEHFYATGNRIRMGVEQDRFGAAVAYHLLTEHPGDYTYRSPRGRLYERVPVAELLHLFVPMRPEQSRGVPWVHAAMVGLHHLGDYRECAVVASRVGAAKMGIITTPDGQTPGADPATGEAGGYTDHGAETREVEPGAFWVFGEDTHLEPFDPTYPHEQFDAFNAAMLRGIAGALGMAHHNLSGDLSGVNYSSARIGEMGERDLWRMLQDWLVGAYAEPVFEEWLGWQMTTGRLALPLAQFERLHAPAFVPRSWDWVDPMKQSQADANDVAQRFTSPQAVIRKRGADPDEVLDEIEAWQRALEERGIARAAPTAPAAPENTDGEDVTDGNADDTPQPTRNAA